MIAPADLAELRGVLRREGLVVQPDRSTAAHLRVYRFQPEVVFDVGVAEGTSSLYRAFPDARFVLIDPRPEVEEILRGPKAPRSASFHGQALGAVAGQMDLLTPVTRNGAIGGRASLNQPTGLMARDITGYLRQTVDVTTLDTVAADYPGQAGLKIDVEGHEAEVLAGGSETLKRCQFVILELSLTQRFDRSPLPSAIFSMLAEAGLEFRDILRITGDGKGGPKPRLIDALFTRWPAPTIRHKGA